MTAGNAKTKWGFNPFFTSDFFYEAGHLSYYLIEGIFDFHLTYDEKDNVTRIYRDNDSTDKGFFFTYDLSVTATHQFYSDHFSIYGVCDAVNLAQFMGWLPDLNPKNKRTSFIYVADIAPTIAAPGYIGKHPITRHVYDSNGNLVSYNGLVWDNDIMFTNVYRCAGEKNTTPK
jgi:hypothetical protein